MMSFHDDVYQHEIDGSQIVISYITAKQIIFQHVNNFQMMHVNLQLLTIFLHKGLISITIIGSHKSLIKIHGSIWCVHVFYHNIRLWYLYYPNTLIMGSGLSPLGLNKITCGYIDITQKKQNLIPIHFSFSNQSYDSCILFIYIQDKNDSNQSHFCERISTEYQLSYKYITIQITQRKLSISVEGGSKVPFIFATTRGYGLVQLLTRSTQVVNVV